MGKGDGVGGGLMFYYSGYPTTLTESRSPDRKVRDFPPFPIEPRMRRLDTMRTNDK